MGGSDTRENVQLIAYADRFGGSLSGLREVLDGPLAGLFAGVHILPFFTPYDGADAGFDPVDHGEVDPRLGSWDDVRALARGYVLMVDLIANHVSAGSAEFRDVLAHGDASPHVGMFLTMGDVYPDGADEAELVGIYRPRPGLPFTAMTLGERRRLVWTTFTGQQVDLNLANPAGRSYLDRVLTALVEGGVSIPLLLHSVYTGDAAPLRRWLDVRPLNAVTVLDTHDGIGVMDVGPDQMGEGRPGLLTPEQVHALVEGIHDRSGGQSRQATGWAASNVDVYQVNCTYYDALGRDDAAYLLARAVQFFTPGIPQVYYVGLLAGGNDMDLLARSGVGRDINRHHYTAEEIARDLARPVVAALVGLIRFRNTHPAFAGVCEVRGGGPRVTLTWTSGEHTAALDADFADVHATLTWTGPDGQSHTCDDLLDLSSVIPFG